MEWYRIGSGSSFDGDMDFTENIINYVEVGKPLDIEVMFSYYVSKLGKYWIKLEELLSFDNFDDFLDYIKLPESDERETRRRLNRLKNVFGKIEKAIKPYRSELSEIFYQKLNNVKDLHQKLQLNITDVNKKQLINEITKVFIFISNLTCGEKLSDKDIDNFSLVQLFDKNYIFPLPNDSGVFSLNSYMYALSKQLHIVGVPTAFSEYDEQFDCAGMFIDHDADHIKRLPNLDTIANEYYAIMKSKLNKDQKEAMIFALWLIYHEFRIKPFFAVYTKFIEFESDYGYKPSYEFLQEMYKFTSENFGNTELENLVKDDYRSLPSKDEYISPIIINRCVVAYFYCHFRIAKLLY